MRLLIVAVLLLVPGLAFSAEETVVYKQAVKANIVKCIGKIKEIGEFVVSDKKHSAVSTWNNKNPNNKLYNSVAVINYSDGNAISVINVAPVQSGGCDATYTRIYYNDKSCLATREIDYKSWKFKNDLNGVLWLTNENEALDVLLSNAGQGCLVMKTEVVYDK